MKKLIVLLLIALAATSVAQDTYKYWIRFADKNGTPYSLDNPSEYLSRRSLDRRAKFHVAIDSLDLPVVPAYLHQVESCGFRVRNVSKWMNGAVVDATDTSNVSLLRALPFVTKVMLYERPCRYVDEGSSSQASIFFREQHPQKYTKQFYNASYRQIEQLNGVGLHKAGYHGEGVLIGVCDAGFPRVDSLSCFSTLRDEGRLIGQRDFVFPGGSVFNDHSHGTMVLSTMAAYDPGMYVGVAYKAEYVLCKTENAYSETPLEEYYWIAAAEYLDSMGADIITTSLGYFDFDDASMSMSMGDLDGKTRDMSIAGDIAATRGMLVVNAAGNNGNDDIPHLNTPADAELVLTVGAVDYHRNVASFSSPGPTADGRIKPDVVALGASVAVALPVGGLMVGNGTSFACPILAGMMACVMQRFGQHTPQQLCDSVRAWGDWSSYPNNYVGYGIPDFGRALETPADPVGVSLVNGIGDIKIYPNPSKGNVTVSVDDSDAILSIYSTMGVMLFQGTANGCQEFLSQQTAGLYHVRYVNATGGSTVKVVRY